MASHTAGRRESSILIEGGSPTFLFIFDRRRGDSPEAKIPFDELADFASFKARVCQIFDIGEEDKHVITTTHREEISVTTWDNVEAGDTLYILEDAKQELAAQAQERVNFLPHYDTIVKGGMYEYYASEGQNPLPYAFAELIDNALAATAENIGPRDIEIQVHLDENVIFVLDNGTGMTSRQLNNWAVYRLSKFIRRDKHGKLPGEDGESRLSPLLMNAPRSLNSDISYFGVGGKQAIFFIGNSTRMITKPRGHQDVHELIISRDEFEQKEKNKEAIYSGYIRNRKLGDHSHTSEADETLRRLIEEEKDKESFTAVVIDSINPDLIPYLKSRVKDWTRQLAHIYHYYIHGPNGNIEKAEERSAFKSIEIMPDDWFSKINIEVKMFTRASKTPQVINLRDVADDMQTQYIRSSSSTFEFKATVEGTGIVEGVLRYHPFLYDRETFPSDANDPRAEPDPEDDHDYTVSDIRPARGRRPIYECYWNGRLIPYTSIEEFDWCSVPKKSKTLPVECYNRVSGVLWTNDKFQVSTNKLTFIDLEMRLRDKNTAYTRILGKADSKKGSTPRKLQDFTYLEKRTDIGKEFVNWLKECHQDCDKQIKFAKFQGPIQRPELSKNRQGPWAVYHQIEWDGKVYKQGTLVKITRVVPIIYGSIKSIMLFGDYEGDVYATGGEIEVLQEPRSLYEDIRILPLNKLDRTANEKVVKKYIEDEEGKLPDRLIITWPNEGEVIEGEKRPAGKPVGDIKVEISNRRGELISKLPGSQQRKLLIELKVIWHAHQGNEVIVQHISHHGKTWPYWFRKMENIKNLGSYSLTLQCVLNESGATKFSGKELPSQRVRFSVTEAEPEKFSVGMLEGPFRIGMPFKIPLEFQDEFGHLTKPSGKLKPILEASGLELSHEGTQISANTLLINNIVAIGEVPSNTGKSFNLTVKVPGLPDDSHTLKIRMLPGAPHSLLVSPEEESVVENGMTVKFSLEVHDKAGNITAQPRTMASLKFVGVPGAAVYRADCSQTGKGSFTESIISMKKMSGEQLVTAKIELENYKSVPVVERVVKVLPSTRSSSIEVSYTKEHELVQLKTGQDLIGTAGELIKGLTFTLFDEAGRQKEIDEEFTTKLKVNWTPKLSRDKVGKSRLPDIKVPTNINEFKYCHITLLDGSGLDFSFTVKSVAGDPSQIKCRCTGTHKVRLGEVLAADILVSVKDKHGNEIRKFEKGVLKDLTVTGEGLVDTSMVRALGQTCGFNIHGLKFESGSLGSREVCVQWQEFKDYVRVEMVAGAPSKLAITGYDLEEPVTVFNDSKLPHSLIVQLCDNAGNPSNEADVKVQLTKDAGIKLNPIPLILKTDAYGQATFGTFTVSGKRGVYELHPKAFIGRAVLAGPKLKVSIQADATKPAQLLVDYNKETSFVVGESLPDFSVRVMAEDETTMTTAKVSCLRMKMSHSDQQANSSAADKTRVVAPEAKRKDDLPGHFHFKNLKAPESSGSHYIHFVYKDDQHTVTSSQIPISIEPGEPETLVAVASPGTPTVSNTKSLSSRTLVQRLLLQLQDKFGNAAGPSVNGQLQVEVDSMQPGSNEIPNLVGSTRKLTVPIKKGQALLQNIVIQENTSGKDGQEYMLRCTVGKSNLPSDTSIPPFEIPFLFYNDVKKQSQMAALSRERDNLLNAIKTYKSLFVTTQQLIDELKLSVQEAIQEENKLKAELRKSGIAVTLLQSMVSVSAEIQKKQDEKKRIQNTPRRMCGLHPAPKDKDVLGKIAHLAMVEDSDIARVLSWHMSADMDCVVTLSTKKAKDIYKDSQGKQQVLPLDSVYKRNLPEWNKPLPHGRFRPSWRPAGSPIYARNLLVFHEDEENCRIVFGMLLGDTIILDNLDDANSYRQELVKFTHCPTILTRGGDRIRSNGKFGGLMNRALPLEKLRGAVFSEPLPEHYRKISSQIDLLTTYKGALQKRLNADEELKEQMLTQQTEEMKAKVDECREAEQGLRDIEQRLGMSTPRSSTPSPVPSPAVTSSTSSRRASTAAQQQQQHRAVTPVESSTEPPSKRRKSAPINGTASPHLQPPASSSPATPTRSLRRAAAESSNAWESLRKRNRRT